MTDKPTEQNKPEWTVKNEPPKCHFTQMEYIAGEDDEWLECRHCGHIKDFASLIKRPEGEE